MRNVSCMENRLVFGNMSTAFTQPDEVKNGCSGVQSRKVPLERWTRTKRGTKLIWVDLILPIPVAFSTKSPGFKDSIGLGPEGVSTMVPGTKQVIP